MQTTYYIIPQRTPSGIRSFYAEQNLPTAYRLASLIIKSSAMSLFSSPPATYNILDQYRIKNVHKSLLAELHDILDSNVKMGARCCTVPEDELVHMIPKISIAIEKLITDKLPIPTDFLNLFDFDAYNGFVHAVHLSKQDDTGSIRISEPFNFVALSRYKDGYLLRTTPGSNEPMCVWKTPEVTIPASLKFVAGLKTTESASVALIINAYSVTCYELQMAKQIYEYINRGEVTDILLPPHYNPFNNTTGITGFIHIVVNLINNGFKMDNKIVEVIEAIKNRYPDRFNTLLPDAVAVEAIQDPGDGPDLGDDDDADSDTNTSDDNNDDDPDTPNNEDDDDGDSDTPDNDDDDNDEEPDKDRTKINVKVPAGSYLINIDTAFEGDIDKYLFREEVISLCKVLVENPPESLNDDKKQFIVDFIKYWIYIVDDAAIVKFAKNVLKYTNIQK